MAGIYIHIPFCVSKCRYCDFVSFPCETEAKKRYVDALIHEMAIAAKELPGKQYDTVFIGGGTPSTLELGEIMRIMAALHDNFSIAEDAEITVEANPGTLDAWKLAEYRECGINRLSMGLQSVNPHILKALGRIHTPDDFLKSMDMAKAAGFTNINADLMYGLPEQSTEDLLAAIAVAAGAGVTHISAYSLIIEKGTPFYELYKFDAVRQAAGMQTESLPTEEEEYQTTKMTQHILKEAGYHWYEISNFAKPGYECRHNIGYWKRVDYLGVGLGASSLIDNVRYSNTRDLYTYLSVPADSLHETAAQITRNEQMEEFMFLGLRMRDGFYRDEFTQAFGIPIEAVYGDALNHLQQEELLLKREGRIYLTDKGMDLNNYVVAQFML